MRPPCGARCDTDDDATQVNFQVTVLKILVSYPDGFAAMAELKRDMAILATSGPDWAERTKRLAARVPDLDIFSQRLIERLNGGWRITARGRAVLGFMEPRSTAEIQPAVQATLSEHPMPAMPRSLRAEAVRLARKQHGRARNRRRAVRP